MRFWRVVVALLILAALTVGVVCAAEYAAQPLPACLYMNNRGMDDVRLVLFDPHTGEFAPYVKRAGDRFSILSWRASDISPNGRVAALYIPYRYGGFGGALWLGEPEEDRLREVINNYGLNYNWSPDGNQLLYLWDEGGMGDWWAAIADSSGSILYKRQLPQLASFMYFSSPVWSADGSYAYFYGMGERGYQTIFLRVADLELYPFSPSDLDVYTSTSTNDPALEISPDGRYAAYYLMNPPTDREQGMLVVTEIASGQDIFYDFPLQEAEVSYSTARIVWSADSQYVASARNLNVYVAGRERPLYQMVNPVIYGIDGSVYRVGSGERWPELMEWRQDGRWTTDGRAWLYWSEGVSEGLADGEQGKLMISYPATQQTEILLDRLPSPPITSPDGRQLLFTQRHDGQLQIGLLDLTTLQSTILLTGSATVIDQLEWSPDGRYLVVVQNQQSYPGSEAPTIISVIDRQQLQVRTLPARFYDLWEWSPPTKNSHLAMFLVRDEVSIFSLHLLDLHTGEHWRVMEYRDASFSLPNQLPQGDSLRLVVSPSGHKIAVILSRPSGLNHFEVPDRLFIADWERKTYNAVPLTPDDIGAMSSVAPNYLEIEEAIWPFDEQTLILATLDYIRVVDVQTMRAQHFNKFYDGTPAGRVYNFRRTWCP